MSGRHTDLRIRISWTQLRPVSIDGAKVRLRLTPINERKLCIHLFDLGGCHCLQNELLPFPPHAKPNSTSPATFTRSAPYAAP